MKVYDFDGTIYDGDSTIDFFLFCLKKQPALAFISLADIFRLVRIKSYRINIDKAKSFLKVLKRVKDIDEKVILFWREKQNKIMPWYLNQKSRNDCIITKSPEFLLRRLVEDKELGNLLGTKIDKHTGVLTGKICYGKEKYNRFRREYPIDMITDFYTDEIKANKELYDEALEVYLVDNSKERITKIK